VARSQVLNASRHHRKNRTVVGLTPQINSECSTPRGITGKIAWRKRVEVEAAMSVLNASRHHRKNRLDGMLDRAKEQRKCSTPRGITGKIARGDLFRKTRKAGGAQRLAASPEKSRIANGNTAGELAVLNASRHHRKNRQFSSIWVWVLSECSTPRGITGKIASARLYLPSILLVLNASRHHRKNRSAKACNASVSLAVLNASRHHRKNRRRGIELARLATGVLNASRHHRKNRRAERLSLSCR